MDTAAIITTLFGFILSLISGVIWHTVRKNSERQNELEKTVKANAEAIIQLNNTAVSDSHVRQVVREELQQLNQNMTNLMTSIRNVDNYIAEQKGFQAAQQLYGRRKVDQE